MKYLRLADIQRDLSTRSLQLIDLVDSYLDRIEAGSDLNLFIEVYEQAARAQALQIQQKVDQVQPGALQGWLSVSRT